MRTLLLAIIANIFISPSFAQKENGAVRNGNRLYKQNNFEQSVTEYNKALSEKQANAIVNYNLGNALFRTNKLEDAVLSYDNAIGNSEEKAVKEKAYYNKGVSLIKQQKLEESIEAWKNALKLDANDTEARENLQKALLEKKKNQPKEENKKEKKEDNKKDKQQQPPQPQQPQSKLSKKQVEQLLKALAQKEKEVQQKMQSGAASPNKQEKDW